MPTITAREYLDPETGRHYEFREGGPAGSGIGRTDYSRDAATGFAVDTWVWVAPVRFVK